MTTPRSRITLITAAFLTASLSLTACGSKSEPAADSTSTMTTPVETAAAHGHVLGDGIQASAGSYNLEILSAPSAAGAGKLSFRILDNGAPLTDFIERHTKLLHMIVVSEDFSNYQHIHPAMSADGTWNVDMILPEGGKHRVIVDFGTTATPDGVALGSIIEVKGASTTTEIAPPAATFSADGFDYTVTGSISADDHGMLMVTVLKDGKPVVFENYLGTQGHLVAFRVTDGAYAHFHPAGHSHGSMDMQMTAPSTSDGATVTTEMATPEPAGMGMSMEMPGMLHFETEVPGAGTYRLFLEFQSEGKVHQASFTVDVA